MLPRALLDRLAAQFGPAATQGILLAFRTDRPVTFRVNTLKTHDAAVMDALRSDGIPFARAKHIPHALLVTKRTDRDMLAHPLAISGRIYLQGLTSMVPPLVLDPRRGDAVLDLCAAPGSKTTQLAALMENRGRVVACEKDEIRFAKLNHTIALQGASIVEARAEDATLLHHTMPEMFDRVLADVPCSAEGRILLADKRSYGFWSEKNIIAHAKLQRRLLRSAVACLRQGGVLVYSTCTLAPEENELMIDWLLADYPCMTTKPVDVPFTPAKKHKNGSVTLLPSKDTEGFFVAKLMKIAPATYPACQSLS